MKKTHILNYKKNNENYEKYKIIEAHSIFYEKHEYIKYPTYGYQILIDDMNKYDILNSIQLVGEDLNNKKSYKILILLINKNEIDK